MHTKIICLFFIPFSVLAQAPMQPMAAPFNTIRGSVHVKGQQPKDGPIVWKHIHVKLPKNDLDERRLIVWIENFSHPSPTKQRNGDTDWLKYDPRKLKVTAKAIDFDAPAGDLIFYRVGSYAKKQ